MGPNAPTGRRRVRANRSSRMGNGTCSWMLESGCGWRRGAEATAGCIDGLSEVEIPSVALADEKLRTAVISGARDTH